ncbi:hypothetical protein AD942_03790 [Gluconobacter japonicus]|nr:hypothetical protein AD942_03790 [Gluconobacter japonicus]
MVAILRQVDAGPEDEDVTDKSSCSIFGQRSSRMDEWWLWLKCCYRHAAVAQVGFPPPCLPVAKALDCIED